MANLPFSVSAKANLTDGQVNGMLLGNGISTAADAIGGFIQQGLNYSMFNSMLDLQTQQMNKYYGLQGDVLTLQGHIADNNFALQNKQLDTAVQIAQLQKDRDVAIAKYRADASVKINRDNVLAATIQPTQYYGQPQIAA